MSRNYLNNRVFLSRNYRLLVAPRKFDVLKTNICPRSEASRANNCASFKNIKFPRDTLIRPRQFRDHRKHFITRRNRERIIKLFQYKSISRSKLKLILLTRRHTDSYQEIVSSVANHRTAFKIERYTNNIYSRGKYVPNIY